MRHCRNLLISSIPSISSQSGIHHYEQIRSCSNHYLSTVGQDIAGTCPLICWSTRPDSSRHVLLTLAWCLTQTLKIIHMCSLIGTMVHHHLLTGCCIASCLYSSVGIDQWDRDWLRHSCELIFSSTFDRQIWLISCVGDERIDGWRDIEEAF